MQKLSALTHENLSATVYATLCDALISGRFRPGERLKIRDIAGQLGTSVTPVRDAVLRLTHDDALVFLTARDIRIPHMSAERYLEIRNIRLRLEAFAAEQAAKRASDSDIAELEDLLRDNEAAMKAGNGLKGAALNQAFHFMLPKIAEMPTLHGILRRLWLQMGPLISEVYLEGGRSMIDHHYPLVEALRRRDPAAAVEAITTDIILGGEMLLKRVGLPAELLSEAMQNGLQPLKK